MLDEVSGLLIPRDLLPSGTFNIYFLTLVVHVLFTVNFICCVDLNRAGE